MSGTGSQLLARRRLLRGLGASVAVAGLAGCSSDGSGDGTSSGTAEPTDRQVGNKTSSPTAEPVDSGTDDSTDGGSDGPAAVVEAYIQAGQNNDSDAMSELVHPDGTATTESEETGGEGTVTVNSVTVVEESDTEALVEVNFSLRYPSEDGDQEIAPSERTTTYETRTYQGSWYVYAIVDSTFVQDGTEGGTATPR
ncbi:hypothetical protein [Haloarcula salinisoli]|uniref:Uncharacterized protein n=1 Tax=Haloarcula salinisoli TaxID=2487746 RepID=A0A8J8CD84_9EURY|nr:hypothetical protein [Halomicroarcula salinisoli]MBX0287102.1 hypothetical protein [Halomicroarcula salinisoli]MBX0304405.1 hypothetical protein [Halomicroarcula salinisoli]